jgi:mannose-6-phosphate isomerase-like protein (cupin superfamily)
MSDDQETTMTNVQPGEGISLTQVPVHFAADGGARTIGAFTFDPPGFEAYISANTTLADPGRLVFVEHSDASWGMWECHTAGDEMVILLSGVALFIQEIDGSTVRTRVTAGQAVLNPAGVWHTADVEEPFDAIYLTPCPGTKHRPR